jgi:hypothetical protein
MWGKVRSCLPSSLGPALLPQSLQGKLSCESSAGPCAREKVVWLLSSRRHLADWCFTEIVSVTARDRYSRPVKKVSPTHRRLRYSITSSARASSDAGTVRPNILAVFRSSTAQVRRLNNWQVSCLPTLEDAVNVASCAAVLFDFIRYVGDQATIGDPTGSGIDCWTTGAGRGRDAFISQSNVLPTERQNVRATPHPRL